MIYWFCFRSSVRPRCIEEVTYTFAGEESPSRARKPHSFEEKLRCTREDRGTSVWRRGKKATLLFSCVHYDSLYHYWLIYHACVKSSINLMNKLSISDNKITPTQTFYVIFGDIGVLRFRFPLQNCPWIVSWV